MSSNQEVTLEVALDEFGEVQPRSICRIFTKLTIEGHDPEAIRASNDAFLQAIDNCFRRQIIGSAKETADAPPPLSAIGRWGHSKDGVLHLQLQYSVSQEMMQQIDACTDTHTQLLQFPCQLSIADGKTAAVQLAIRWKERAQREVRLLKNAPLHASATAIKAILTKLGFTIVDVQPAALQDYSIPNAGDFFVLFEANNPPIPKTIAITSTSASKQADMELREHTFLRKVSLPTPATAAPAEAAPAAPSPPKPASYAEAARRAPATASRKPSPTKGKAPSKPGAAKQKPASSVGKRSRNKRLKTPPPPPPGTTVKSIVPPDAAGEGSNPQDPGAPPANPPQDGTATTAMDTQMQTFSIENLGICVKCGSKEHTTEQCTNISNNPFAPIAPTPAVDGTQAPDLAGSSSTSPRSSVLWPPARTVSGQRHSNPPAAYRRRLGTLKIISHNINGFSRKVSSFVKLWNALGADIVLLQETHLSTATAKLFDNSLSQWACYWGHKRGPTRHGIGAPTSKASAGVGLLIRKRCLVQYGGHISVVGNGCSTGHHIARAINWMGHRLHVASIYLPTDPTARGEYIDKQIKSLYASNDAQTRTRCWGGDFNFVTDSLDRISNGVATILAVDQRSAAKWAQATPELVDCFRSRHPTRRCYSYHNTKSTGCSRLDRFYLDNAGMPYVLQSGVATTRDAARCDFLSDHRPTYVSLLHRTAFRISSPTSHRGRRLAPKVHTEFTQEADLKEEFTTAVAAAAAEAPPSDAELLAWWPGFKETVATLARHLNTQHRRRYSERLAAAENAVTAIKTRIENGDHVARGELGAARHAVNHIVTTTSGLHNKYKWLHQRELPNPSITARLKTSKDAFCGPSLRGRGGRLESAAGCCADIMVDHYAATSTNPTTCPAAQEEVLAALEGHTQLPAEACCSLEVSVSEAEVKVALKRAKPTAPGFDRLPAVIYRVAASTFVPLLARLFTAIGSTGSMPHNFNTGIIVPLHKGGDRTIPNNYRPITLLNTDYRILAAVLGNRLKTYLPGVIDPVQTAFLSGRNIGENILFLQLLPQALAQHQCSGIVAFCDFNKAYDTIDRNFLFQVMQRLGANDGLLKWVSLLLSATSARALVMGTLSKLANFNAGVRQGCPLAPLLYLFIGEALLAFLKSKGFGMQLPDHPDLPPLPLSVTTGPANIPSEYFLPSETTLPAQPLKQGPTVTAIQYADDFKALLTSPAEVPAFVAAMKTFGDASGQTLNLEKSKLLPIGTAYPLAATSIAGLSVVSEATALGVIFSNFTNPARMDEEGLNKRIATSFDRIAHCNLSAFGRGYASAAYGISSLLHAAEFVGLSLTQLNSINTLITKLVDRNGKQVGFTGVGSELLGGPPNLGGFGALPLSEHIQARAAKWLLRATVAGSSTPWSALIWSILAHSIPLPLQPIQLFSQHIDFFTQTLSTSVVAFPPLPPPLQRLWDAAHSLPHLCRRVSGADGTIALSTDWLPLPALLYWRLTRSQCYVSKLLQLGTPTWPCTSLNQVAEKRPVLWQYTVKLGTRYLSNPKILERAQRFAAFLSEVPAPPVAASDSLSVTSTMEYGYTLTKLWKLPLPNALKEPYWRCFLNALPTAQRLDNPHLCGCRSGPHRPGRKHHFYDCFVAQELFATIQTHLPVDTPQLAYHLRSAVPPPGIHSGIWSIVSLAACSALDTARRHFRHSTAILKERRTLELRERTRDLAILSFWSFLHEASSAPLPHRWRSAVDHHHPFMHWDATISSWCVTQV